VKKLFGILTIVALMAVVFAGCTDDATPNDNGNGGETPAGLVDGTWVGNATMNPENTRYSFGTVALEVVDGEIVSVDYKEIQGPFAEAKGEDYSYEAFFTAVDELSQKLVETQSVDELDTVAGATSTSGYFVEAVTNALESANAGQQLYNNGTYAGVTEADSRGVRGVGYVTFANGSVSHVLYEERDSEGAPKGEDYSYELYHEAVASLQSQLMDTSSLSDVDTVAGATSTSNNFVEVFAPYFSLSGN